MRQEALELAVEDIGDAVVVRVAARPAVRLHQGLRRLERVPAGIARLAGGGPRVAEVGVGQLRHDLKTEEIVRQVHAFS